jgi:hypothetical protein
MPTLRSRNVRGASSSQDPLDRVGDGRCLFGRHVVTRPAGVHEQPNPTGGVDSMVEARDFLVDFRSGNAPRHGDRGLDFEMIERLAQRAL